MDPAVAVAAGDVEERRERADVDPAAHEPQPDQ
jgi:hypothetical protein